MKETEQFERIQTPILENQNQQARQKIQWIWERVTEASVVRKWIGKRGCEKENEKRKVDEK